MSLPRFYVAKTGECFAVLDRAYAHRAARIYRGAWWAHCRAEQACAELNAKHGPWPVVGEGRAA